jgi:hypothetical protein
LPDEKVGVDSTSIFSFSIEASSLPMIISARPARTGVSDGAHRIDGGAQWPGSAARNSTLDVFGGIVGFLDETHVTV